MGVSFAVLTSHPGLLGCQLLRLSDQVSLADASPLNTVGVGTYAQDDVLLSRHTVSTVPQGLTDLPGLEASEALLYQAQHLPVAASLENHAQPFRFRRWLFTFDGQLEHFEHWRSELHDGLPPYLQRQMGVETPGEAAFSLFLKKLRDHGRTDDPKLDPRAVAALLLETAKDLVARSAKAGAVRAPALRLLATNSLLLVAARVGDAALHYRLLEGAATCDACGLSPGHGERRDLIRAHQLASAVAVASGLKAGARWLELPAGAALAVGAELRPTEVK